MKRLARLAPLAFPFLLAGCMVGPNYKRPAVSLPPAYRGAAPAAPAPSLGNEKWWQVFKDPVLDKLIHTALSQNYDVRIAATRVLEAQAELGITRSSQFPSVSAGAGLLTQKNAKTSRVFPSYETNAGRVSLTAIWDLDFWGKYRRENEAARAQLLSTVWGRRAVMTSVVASVASAYFQLRALDSELAIARSTLASRQDSLRLTSVLAKHGSATALDISQARQLVYAASESIPDIQRQITQQENLLTTLLGQNPGSIDRGLPLVQQPEPATIPAGLPSELIDRRPDIREAEQSLIVANADIGVLKASLFPDISLTGTGGLESNALNRIISGSAENWNAAINLTQPVFQAGELRAGVQLARAQWQQMLLTYRQTILNALEQVSSSLVAYDRDREFRRQQQQLTLAAQETNRLSMILYHNGGASYLQVLTSETDLFAAQLNLIQAQLNERLALVQIYQALGGGWQQ
ncbi:MAG TPA: efflux transporter outer membrane subunit [Candidatus Dormibacteraeota bacterium]|nr:efflux transporter outer membrane subunit [Candidatus Dormibacteraeota bacterium]